MSITDAIKTFRAIRQFTDQPLSDEEVTEILNAGRRAQSSMPRCKGTSTR